MTSLVQVKIPGRPVAKQRARTRHGKFYTPAATRRFEEMVSWQALSTGVSDLRGSLSVEIAIATKRPLRGDVDNYAKAILDGLVKGGLISDDREITHLCISKGRTVADEPDMTTVVIEWNGSEASQAHP